eukprot:Skav235932  [mRNA]  locus=scaffold6173:10245:11563:+ [translate_table: standard]
MVLRLLTFNIWFHPHQMQRRMQAISDIIARTEPDLIAFQEMTADHWDLLSSHEIMKRYSWSDAPRQRYYTLIGSLQNCTIDTFERFPFKETLSASAKLLAEDGIKFVFLISWKSSRLQAALND